MTHPPLRVSLLAMLGKAVGTDLLADLSTARTRDAATSIGRLLARLRVELEQAPVFAAERLPEWQRVVAPDLPQGRASVAEPLSALRALAARAGDTLRTRCTEPAFLHGLAQEGSAEAAWFTQVLAATRRYVDAVENAVAPPDATQASPLDDPDTLRRRLADYLVARYPQLPAEPILSLRVIPGGRSKQTALFELRPNDVLPTRLVLRRDIGNASTGTAVFGEFALLQALDAMGLPVPMPVAAERNPAALGGGFILVAEVQGAERAGDLFPELNDMARIDASFAPDLARALARLHSLRSVPEGVDLGGHHAATEPLAMVRNFQALWAGIEHKPPMSVATELGFAWLQSHPLPSDRPRRLVHGDVGFHNMMLRDGRLASILDWELTHLGDPAEDIGYIRAPVLAPLMPWDEFVALYVAHGGEPSACDVDAVDWYSVWAHTRNSVYTAMLFDFASRGERNDLDAFYPAVDLSPRTQHYILRELERALPSTRPAA